MPEHATTCFFFNDTATTEIYTLSLHDALPILSAAVADAAIGAATVSPPPVVLALRLNEEVPIADVSAKLITTSTLLPAALNKPALIDDPLGRVTAPLDESGRLCPARTDTLAVA